MREAGTQQVDPYGLGEVTGGEFDDRRPDVLRGSRRASGRCLFIVASHAPAQQTASSGEFTAGFLRWRVASCHDARISSGCKNLYRIQSLISGVRDQPMRTGPNKNRPGFLISEDHRSLCRPRGMRLPSVVACRARTRFRKDLQGFEI